MTEIEKAFLAGYVEAKGRPYASTNQTGRKYLLVTFKVSNAVAQLLIDAFGGVAGALTKRGRRWTLSGIKAAEMVETLWPYFTPRRRKTITALLGVIAKHNETIPQGKRGRPRKQ